MPEELSPVSEPDPWDPQNYRALELFSNGQFTEAARLFTHRRYVCAALLNSGDRAALIVEQPDYQQVLHLCVARADGTPWLIRKIAKLGLSDRSAALDPLFRATISKKGRWAPRLLVDRIIVPGFADSRGNPCFITDQRQIDNLILRRDIAGAEEAIRRAQETYGDHPVLRHDEVRVWRSRDLARSLELALALAEAFPDYFPGIKSSLSGAVGHMRKGMSLSADVVARTTAIAERGALLDPLDRQVNIALRGLRMADRPGFATVASAFGFVPWSRVNTIVYQRKMLRRIKVLYESAVPERA